MICKRKSTKLNCPKLLCITNNSIKHRSFVYTLLNVQKILFQTIQFSASPLFALSLNGKIVLFDPLIGPYLVQSLQTRVDLGAMAMKGYPNSPNLQHYWSLPARLFCVISRTLVEGRLPLCRDTVSIFSNFACCM